VQYVIRAEIVLRPHATGGIGKYLDQFNRRAERGQCHHTPCLGTREFAASFEAPASNDRGDRSINLDIGQMLFDIAFIETPKRKGELEFFKSGLSGQRKVKGKTESLFFHANIAEGILKVPPEKYRELYSMEGADD
jgi:CRISPR-associated protein Cas5d